MWLDSDLIDVVLPSETPSVKPDNMHLQGTLYIHYLYIIHMNMYSFDLFKAQIFLNTFTFILC